jgi:hypothetical protein
MEACPGNMDNCQNLATIVSGNDPQTHAYISANALGFQ